jgi:hypothetical protein
MSPIDRAMKLLDQLPSDLTLSELREIAARVQKMQQKLLKAKARNEHAAELTGKYPGLQALLDSGRAELGAPKTPGLYAPTGFRLPAGLTSRELLDLDRGDR